MERGAAGGHLARRFESAEAAICLVDLEVFGLFIALAAFEAIFADVLTEFFAMLSPPFRNIRPAHEVVEGNVEVVR